MIAVFRKELQIFLSSLIAYIVIAVFLTITGLFIWVFGDTSVLNYNFATLEQLFTIGPLILLFLVPAITMRSFAEEYQDGTMELLLTKPLHLHSILIGKYFANTLLIFLAILPTGIYVYSIYQLGLPPGNLDIGATLASYAGMILCAFSFVAIGMFASALTNNQIVGFLLGAFICFMMFLGFDYLSSIYIFQGRWDLVIQKLGIYDHYVSISKGAIQLRDVFYFISVIGFFLILTMMVLNRKRN